MERTVMVVLAEATAHENPRWALAAAARLRRELDRVEAEQVQRARAEGLTWAEIAEVLGVTKQAAHKRYGERG